MAGDVRCAVDWVGGVGTGKSANVHRECHRRK
jgi:hypothetical protein